MTNETTEKPDDFENLTLQEQIERVIYTKIYKGKDLLEAKNMPVKAYHLLRSELLDVLNDIKKWESYDKDIFFKLLESTVERVAHFIFDDKEREIFFCNQLIYCTVEQYKLMK
jgi:hypothetical protein